MISALRVASLGMAGLVVLVGCSQAPQPVPTLTAVPGVVDAYVQAVVAEDVEAAGSSVTYLGADGKWVHGDDVAKACVEHDIQLWAEHDPSEGEATIESSTYDNVELEPGAAPVDVVVSIVNFEFKTGEIVGRGLQWVDGSWLVEIDGSNC